jgi:hypothetical protein
VGEPIDPNHLGKIPPGPDQPGYEHPWTEQPGTEQPKPGYTPPPAQAPSPYQLGYQPGYEPSHQPTYPPAGHQQPGYQPQGQQPGYSQPGYQQPSYPQAGYPQAGYPPGGYPPAGYQPYASPLAPVEQKKSRRTIIVAVVAVLVAAGVAAGVIASLGSSGTHSNSKTPLVLPAAIGSYTQITDASADRVRTAIQSQYGTGGTIADFFNKATLGVYGSGDATPQLILVAGRASQFPDLTPSSLAGTASGGSALAFSSYSAGSLGGALRCTNVSLGALSENLCIWSDKKTIGFLDSIQTNLTTKQVATLVNDARSSLEH